MLETKKFTLTVEGETEKLYFTWLEKIINSCEEKTYKVSLNAKVQQSPRSFYKGTNSKVNPVVFHVCDVESTNKIHLDKLNKILKEMKEAKTFKGIKYNLGYSNFSFELWMVLHRNNCFGKQFDRSKYLVPLQKCFNEKFEDLKHFKQHDTFIRCLNKLSLSDVKDAIKRAEIIQKDNINSGNILIKYAGYEYYKENPSLSINNVVKTILIESGLF